MSKPLGPYTPVVRAGDFIIISGQGGLLDGIKVDGGVVPETAQAMKNIESLLATMGATRPTSQRSVTIGRHGRVWRSLSYLPRLWLKLKRGPTSRSDSRLCCCQRVAVP
jgi:hypothetical protein